MEVGEGAYDGQQRKAFFMNTCRNNWTSFLAQKSEGGAVAKIQCKTGVKTQMCKLCLWQGVPV